MSAYVGRYDYNSPFKEWFGQAYADLTEDQKILLNKPSSEAGGSLLSNLEKLWVISFLIHTCEESHVMRKDVKVSPNAKASIRNDLRRQGREHKKFWLVKKNYESIVQNLRGYVEKNIEPLVQGFLSENGLNNTESSRSAWEETVREVLDDFTNDLEIIRKGVEADLKKDFWEWAKEWLYPVAPATVVLLLGILDYCTRD